MFQKNHHSHNVYWHDLKVDVAHPSDPEANICSSTLTYMLDGFVGVATDLAYLAQFAGLARERNRTLFVIDRFWNRGRWVAKVDTVLPVH